jgi:endonuclease III
MKNGTAYARKLKSAYSKFKGMAGVKPSPEPVDPVDQLVLATLSQECPASRAAKALKQLQQDMIDYNELRVSTPAEISESIGRLVPRSVYRAKILVKLLNAVFQREYAVSLASLSSKGVRDAKAYLDSLDGMTPYVSASILLWSLGGHAIPVNDGALDFLRRQELIEPTANSAEVQAFLERNISSAEARSFCLDLEAYVASKPSGPDGGSDGSAKGGGKSRRAGSKSDGGAGRSRARKKSADAT